VYRLDFNGRVIKPARILCALKEAFDAVKPGERISLTTARSAAE